MVKHNAGIATDLFPRLTNLRMSLLYPNRQNDRYM